MDTYMQPHLEIDRLQAEIMAYKTIGRIKVEQWTASLYNAATHSTKSNDECVIRGLTKIKIKVQVGFLEHEIDADWENIIAHMY